MRVNLAEKRKEKKMTQAELASAVGLAQRTIAAYESRERRPSVDAAKLLGEALDFPWMELYEEEDAKEAGSGRDAD